MSESNVWVPVPDPAHVMGGDSPDVPFAATRLKLFRYTTEAAARASVTGADTGTLIKTWTLVAHTAAITEAAGPYRYGYYDSGQVTGASPSWYRTHYSDTAGTTYSLLSDPWPAGAAPAWQVRELILETGKLLGEKNAFRATATAGTATTITCAVALKSTLKDDYYYRGGYILIDYDAGGARAAPEGEERLVDSVAASTGVATVDNDYTAAVASGDIFQLHMLASPLSILDNINRVRRRMYTIATQDYAIDQSNEGRNRYPAPYGVTREDEIIDAAGVAYWNDNKIDTSQRLPVVTEQDGNDVWLFFPDGAPAIGTVRVRYEKSFRHIEGELSRMDDVTYADKDWLCKAAAWETYKLLDDSEQAANRFSRLTRLTADEVAVLSGRFAPSYVRPIVSARRETVGPLPLRF